MSFYSLKDLKSIGFGGIGNNVLVSKKASFYGMAKIKIGNNVRIDDFCVLSAGKGGIEIGNNIHIAVYSSIIGAGKVILSDFCNISSRVSIYSSNDDYSGEFMSNPMVDEQYTNVFESDVVIGPHVIIGSGSVILPGAELAKGSVVGALSLVNKSTEPFKIYAGQPIKFLKNRKTDLLDKEKEFHSTLKGNKPC